MSFRRRRDVWDDFLKRHAEELRACGIPREVLTPKMRFLVFLDHGYDEWGWFETRDGCFQSDFMNDDQIARLAVLVATHIGESYRVRISSRWRRWH